MKSSKLLNKTARQTRDVDRSVAAKAPPTIRVDGDIHLEGRRFFSLCFVYQPRPTLHTNAPTTSKHVNAASSAGQGPILIVEVVQLLWCCCTLLLDRVLVLDFVAVAITFGAIICAVVTNLADFTASRSDHSSFCFSPPRLLWATYPVYRNTVVQSPKFRNYDRRLPIFS